MYPANPGGLPTPLSSLDDLIESGGAEDKPFKVFIGHNLGYRTFTMQVPMGDFYELSDVANDPAKDGETVAQRKLDVAHATKLAIYILKGLVSSAIAKRAIDKRPTLPAFEQIQQGLGKQPYLSIQPIVVNIRECTPGGQNIRGLRMTTTDQETASFKVFLAQQHTLWVVDGQHRRKAMEMVFDYLKQVRTKLVYPKKGLFNTENTEVSAEEATLWEECYAVARGFCTIAVEVHLGLNVEQERQLFHDLNRLGKKVETSLALQFDTSNPINLFIKERLVNELGMKVQEKDIIEWKEDAGGISRKDLVAVNALLFLNKTNVGSASPNDVLPKMSTATRFWEAVMAIPGFGEDQARLKTIAAQPVVLKSMAKLVYDFAFSNRRPETAEELLQTLFDGISSIDFSHENPLWRYYELSPKEIEANGLTGLKEYLPSIDESANRDIGKHQGGYMRFGAKHNDIYPIIGDMIRWRMGLPSRQKSTKLTLNDI